MKIGIIGTRGIPNQYGGFEQCAEYFATILTEKGHDVTVYISHKHPYSSADYKGVKLVRCYDPEHRIGTAGQFIYDFNCIRDSRKKQYDIILQLGYTSSTIWSWLYPKSSLLVTNMDGLEWTRQKYNSATRYFLTLAEKWGVKYSNYLIADSIPIQDYLRQKYNSTSTFVPYGANVFQTNNADEKVLENYGLTALNYDLVIARFEPENNIETILRAYKDMPENALVLIGRYENTAFGRKMHKLYSHCKNIKFAGPEFNIDKLNTLRHFSRLYLHGHSVGGTNPSLLEAMSCQTLICAHDNVFNRHVLGNDALYFQNSNDIINILSNKPDKKNYQQSIENNCQKIRETYNWNKITDCIEELFIKWKDEKVA